MSFSQLRRAFHCVLDHQLCSGNAWLPACSCCAGFFEAGGYFVLLFDYLPIFADSCFQFLEPGTEPFTPEQEFGEMTLSDYDSNEDADFEPTYSEESSDDLEYDSDASVSSASEEEESASDV